MLGSMLHRGASCARLAGRARLMAALSSCWSAEDTRA